MASGFIINYNILEGLMTALKIVKGEDISLNVQINMDTGEQYDLTGVAAIEAWFPGESACVSRTLALGHIVVDANPLTGKMVISLDDTTTPLLQTGNLSFEVKITKGTETRIVQFEGALDVVERLCS